MSCKCKSLQNRCLAPKWSNTMWSNTNEYAKTPRNKTAIRHTQHMHRIFPHFASLIFMRHAERHLLATHVLKIYANAAFMLQNVCAYKISPNCAFTTYHVLQWLTLVMPSLISKATGIYIYIYTVLYSSSFSLSNQWFGSERWQPSTCRYTPVIHPTVRWTLKLAYNTMSCRPAMVKHPFRTSLPTTSVDGADL